MGDDTTERLEGTIKVDEGQLQGHVDEAVRTSVEETLNTMLEAEADQLCRAQRYERSPERAARATATTAPPATPRRSPCGWWNGRCSTTRRRATLSMIRSAGAAPPSSRRKSRRLRTFHLPVAPTRANVDGRCFPAAATTKRNRVHDPARDRLDHHPRRLPRDGTAAAHVRPPGADPGGSQRCLPPGLPGATVPVPQHRPRPGRPSHRLLGPRRAGRRAHHAPDPPVSTRPARRRGGHWHHQPGDLGPPPHGHARRPLGLARHRARLPRPAPRESPPPGLLRAPRIPRRPRPPPRPVAGHPRPRLLLRLAQE